MKKDIYGGSNNSGFANTGSTNSNIRINMQNGIIDGSLYGGSNVKGTVYGNVYLNITGGTIKHDIYGGGKGGYTNATNPGTFIRDNVELTIGNSTSRPNINGDVYGGSAFGTVNAISTTEAKNDKTILVTVNNAEIHGSVFGGAKGDNTYIPYAKGNIEVNINGGKITNVYGGFDETGTPEGTSVVNLNGGIIGAAFGGGNKTNITETNVNLQGATALYVYGGSNNLGNINKTNVNINSGTSNYVFGGNNLGGSVVESNVKMNDGTITYALYGGGNEATCTTSTVNVYKGTVKEVYGGGNNAGLTNTNVGIVGGNVTSVYGGSNKSGDIDNTNVSIGKEVSSENDSESNSPMKINVTYTPRAVTWESRTKATYSDVTVEVLNNSDFRIDNWQIELDFPTGTEIYSNYTRINFGIENDKAFIVGEDKYNGNNPIKIQSGGKETFTFAVLTDASVADFNITAKPVIVKFEDTSLETDEDTTEYINLVDVYGGNNKGGTVKNTHVTNTIGNIVNLYGGGNEAEAENTYVDTQSGIIENTFGGGNEAEVDNTTVIIRSGVLTNVYGGGNKAAVKNNTDVTMDLGTVTNLYGAGNMAGADTTNVLVNGGKIYNLYGGANRAGNITNSYITSNIEYKESQYVTVDIDYDTRDSERDDYQTIIDATITVKNISGNTFYDYVGYFFLPNSVLLSNNSNINLVEKNKTYTFTSGALPADGSISFDVSLLTNTNPELINFVYGIKGWTNGSEKTGGAIDFIVSIYGGNNQGGSTQNTNVEINDGRIGSIFGGGEKASIGNSNVIVHKGLYNFIYGGGNEGETTGNTKVTLLSGQLLHSVYAGGNGAGAIVYGNTEINVAGDAVIGNDKCTNPSRCGVFGGGNAAQTGSVESPSSALVNITGGKIYGNVYGGANTSKIYGQTKTNIGSSVQDQTLTKGNIDISGTVFGGGEANASGSEIFDFSFISVTDNIEVNIDASNYNNLNIEGSIFGSGNASSTSGTSSINVKNYGEYTNPKKNISIQRTDVLTLDNSNIYLDGATDRTNEYSDVLFSMSRVSETVLKNNSTLFLTYNTNLLSKFTSVDSTDNKAYARIDEDGAVERNVKNALYIKAGGNINIAKDQSITSYGEVSGMTFFGMFTINSDGSINTGIYDTKYNSGDRFDAANILIEKSYVLGLHNVNHDIEVDGFYTNYESDEAPQTNIIKYIEPTPENSSFYMWIVGEGATTYTIDLQASKYSSLGTKELTFYEFNQENTSFQVSGFDTSEVAEGVRFINKRDIAKVAPTEEEANNIFALTMESSNKGWLTSGTTNFLSESPYVTGEDFYVGENSTVEPSMLFALHHSKNLTQERDLGTVKVAITSIRQVDPLTKDTDRIIINIDLSSILYQSTEYEAAITPGNKYDMFTTTTTNITDNSKFSAYFSLFSTNTNVYKPRSYRTLVSSLAFPEGTKITMIDLNNNNSKYYYHIVTAAEEQQKINELTTKREASYNFADFIEMGTVDATSNYSDSQMNQEYIIGNSTNEEFVFIVDFADVSFSEYLTRNNLSESILQNNSLLIELRQNNDYYENGNLIENRDAMIGVLGIERDLMVYNIYQNQNANLEVHSTLGNNPIYVGKKTSLDIDIDYSYKSIDSVIIYDTTYFDSKLGLEITIRDQNGQPLPGTTLQGLYVSSNNTKYYPNIDGTIRIKAADKVGITKAWLQLSVENASIPTGDYKLNIKAFGSPDGLYYGSINSEDEETDITIINSIYGIKANIEDESVIINAKPGTTQNDSKEFNFDYDYTSGLTNPKIYMALYRRNYRTIYDTTYTQVNINDFFDITEEQDIPNLVLLTDDPQATNTGSLTLKDNLLTGTYKVDFMLYDNGQVIGTVSKYIVIKGDS